MDPTAVAQLLQSGGGQPGAAAPQGGMTAPPAPTPQQLLAIQNLMKAPGGLGAMAQPGAPNPLGQPGGMPMGQQQPGMGAGTLPPGIMQQLNTAMPGMPG
jgi:hypothetical protein